MPAMRALCALMLVLSAASAVRAEPPSGAAPLEGLLGGGRPVRVVDPLAQLHTKIGRLEARADARELGSDLLHKARAALDTARDRLSRGERQAAERAFGLAEAAVEVLERRLARAAAAEALAQAEREAERALQRRTEQEAALERARRRAGPGATHGARSE